MPKLLREYETGEAVDSIAMLTSLSVKETRQQKPFLQMEFGDSSGRVAGVMWEGFTEEMTRIAPGTVLRVQGRMDAYNDRPQIAVRMLGRPAPGTWDLSRLLPSTERDVNEMLGELDTIVRGIHNPELRRLLETMFNDPELRKAYSTAPAAKRWHQPWLGGLLEHTLNVHRHAVNAAVLYPEADPDIVSAGVLLHDIGKIVEYEVENFFETSTRGRLLGHLVIGVEMLDSWLQKVGGVPEQTGWLLKHIILSHHGQLEYGSPVLPQTLEALLVHFADDLDAKMSGVLRVWRRGQEEPGDWTEPIRLLDRRFFKAGSAPGEQENDKPETPPAPAPHRHRKASSDPGGGGEQQSFLP
ncbi:HD domain-containing protein [bacterium]|nr:HD domain-containing protein [bacterium]